MVVAAARHLIKAGQHLTVMAMPDLAATAELTPAVVVATAEAITELAVRE
jgi:hypothetical protein